MASKSSLHSNPLIKPLFFLLLLQSPTLSHTHSLQEATIPYLQQSFNQNKLTSRQLVQHYIQQIHNLNPLLRAVIELNPDALSLADKADKERKQNKPRSPLGALHGIPVLVKDNIATKDKMNTTAGSFALLGSVVPRNAFVVKKLIDAGAIILGKASLSEWSNAGNLPVSGWCARSGQGRVSQMVNLVIQCLPGVFLFNVDGLVCFCLNLIAESLCTDSRYLWIE